MNLLLIWALIVLWRSQAETLDSLEVTWHSKEILFPRKFSKEENARIYELVPMIEDFLNNDPLNLGQKEAKDPYDPFFIRDIEVSLDRTTVRISFFRDLLNESYDLTWERHLPPFLSSSGNLGAYVISDDFLPRIFEFDSDDQLIPLKPRTQPSGAISDEASPSL